MAVDRTPYDVTSYAKGVAVLAKKCWWVIVMGLFLVASAATANDTGVHTPTAETVEVTR